MKFFTEAYMPVQAIRPFSTFDNQPQFGKVDITFEFDGKSKGTMTNMCFVR